MAFAILCWNDTKQIRIHFIVLSVQVARIFGAIATSTQSVVHAIRSRLNIPGRTQRKNPHRIYTYIFETQPLESMPTINGTGNAGHTPCVAVKIYCFAL